jgi:hypothetical protein
VCQPYADGKLILMNKVEYSLNALQDNQWFKFYDYYKIETFKISVSSFRFNKSEAVCDQNGWQHDKGPSDKKVY